MSIHSLTREELLALLAAAKAKRERDWLMLLVGFLHGLRASEVLALTRDSISPTHITVQRLKGSEKTVQPLVEDSDPLLNEKLALIEFTRGLEPNQRLFKLSRVRLWQLFQEYGAAAGIPEHKRHPHVLKHSIAMQTIEDAGIENVRKHLGHKSMASTGEYLKPTDEEASARVRRALKRSQG